MQMDGIHILQPTALAIKLAPSCSATVNIGGFPAEITIALRHIPQPEHLAKGCGRSIYTTYHGYLVNNRLNTKTFLGPISKFRPGSFQLITEHIPEGTWDQLVVSLTHDDPSDLGLPLFTFSGDFNNTALSPERYTTLPADFLHAECSNKDALIPVTKPKCHSMTHNIKSAAAPNSELLNPNAELTDVNAPSISAKESACNYDGDDESGLLQPGTVLPEEGIFIDTPNIACPSEQKTAPEDGPVWIDPAMSERIQSQQTLVPIAINELTNHALWLVNYQGIQLVGYVYNSSDPQKPVFIVHGVPGEQNRKSKPEEQGYDYWVGNPAGKGGYWLRYINALDNLIAHPFPVTGKDNR